MATIHGPAPIDVCPLQTVADTEDYAVNQLATGGMAPLTVHVGRRQTVGVAQGAEGEALSPRAARARLCGRFSGVGSGDPAVMDVKTMAHSTWEDARAGRSPEKEERGSDHSDQLATAGATMHGLTPH